MKIKFIFLAVLAGSYTLFAGGNILKNGDLSEKDSSGFAAHWQIWPKKLSPEVSVTFDNTNSKTGGRSVCIKHTNEHRYTRIDQLHIPCKPHTKYVARFWAKGQNITTSQQGGARMFIGPHGDLSRPIIQFGPGLEQFKRKITYPWNFNWTLFESNVFNSGTSKELGVTLYFRNAAGIMWFDDIEIVEYTPNVKANRDAERARRLIRQDIAQVEALAPELKNELAKISADTAQYVPQPRDPRMGMPFFAPQRELGKVFSKVLQAKFNTSDIIVTSAADALKMQSAFIVPAGKSAEKIVVEGLKNEVEAFALNLTNPTAATKRVKITVPENLELSAYKVIHVETDRVTVVDDAMLPLKFDSNGTGYVKVPAGMTRLIYFKTRLEYARSGVIEIDGKSITIDCRPKKTLYPQEQFITLFSYAYPYRYSFIEKLDQARKLRFEMHNNGAMPYQFCAPLPYFDENGKFIRSKMNWGKLDAILAMTPKPHKLIFSMPIHSPAHIKESLGTDKGKAVQMFSKEWERRLGCWLRALTAGLKRRGINYSDFALALIDEPGDERIEYMRKATAVIKKIDKNLRVYNNSNYSISENRFAEFAQIPDIVAPEIGGLTPAKLNVLKKANKEIWAYHVQNRSYPADRMRDNFAFMRKNDIKGFSYWCFYDSSPRWMPTGSQSYAIFYDDDNGQWHLSKRGEGIREGVELYTLLTLVKEQSPMAYKKLCSNIGTASGIELRRQALKNIR